MAVSNNAVCDNLRGEPKLEYTIWLTPEERRIYWAYDDLFMIESRFGNLLMNDTACIKTPIHHQSYIVLALLSRSVSLPCIPDYHVHNFHVHYNKVHHDPLSHEEARKCSYELVLKINDVIKQLYSVGFSHGDLRLANICFNMKI